MIKCKHCESENIRKNGTNRKIQRYFCNNCKRTFSVRDERFGKRSKAQALLMYLNNVGIRKCALFLRVSRQTISNWIEEAHEKYSDLWNDCQFENRDKIDVIELDEIYTYVKKKHKKSSYGLLILEERNVLLRL